MADAKICGRFAPSPSGRMHLGNIFCALLAWLSARAQNGSMLLRIEDLDTSRCTEEKARLLMDDLLWLGSTGTAAPFPAKRRMNFTKAAVAEFIKSFLKNCPHKI